MSAFYRSLAAYEPLIYIALAIWGLFLLRAMFQHWTEWRNSVYGLEREFALRRLVRSTALGLLVLGVIFAEFFIATFVVPSLPGLDALSTPTLNLLVTPVNTLSPEEAAKSALSPASQPSLPGGMSGCVPDEIMIDSPNPGDPVTGTVTLSGTASVPNFGFYKYEVSSMGSNLWATISAGDAPVRQARLGDWVTSTLANGDYFLRLVIIDGAGKTLEPCVIAVRVDN
jgi:hypothetical protein